MPANRSWDAQFPNRGRSNVRAPAEGSIRTGRMRTGNDNAKWIAFLASQDGTFRIGAGLAGGGGGIASQ